jgi:exo-1,4-beta-D-glucosaminidase
VAVGDRGLVSKSVCAVAALGWLLACRSAPPATTAIPAPAAEATRVLAANWRLHAARGLAAGGAEISRSGFEVGDWIETTVPSTVLAALSRQGGTLQRDTLYHGDNLERVPREWFTTSWWYRHEFSLAAVPAEARLVFEGINYRADVWLNGEKIADRADLAGAFRVFELAVTAHLRAGANVLAVEVLPPQPGEPTIGFVDWNPEPPDRNMGLWREVKLRSSAGVALDEAFVRSELSPALDEARLTVSARLVNHGASPVAARLRGRITPAGGGEGLTFETAIGLAGGERRTVALDVDALPQLRLAQPRLWWPYSLGEPNLYRLELEAIVEGRLADRQEVTFGVRKVEDYLDAEGRRGYAVNGKRLLIRGGGWVDDLLLADDDRRLEDQIRYVRQMNLNTIRLEGFWGSTQKLYELADRYGILVMVGWSCQWEWQDYLGQPVDETYGGIDTAEEMALVNRSLRDQIVRLRNHPSVLTWVLASDMLPRPELERLYRETLAEADPTRPPLSACSVRTSEVSGPTGVKMNGPYEWVPPDYWYLDSERGGAYGFNTETGPGAQPPPAASIRRMLPREHWWPIDAMWNYHCGRHEFASLDRYRQALAARYGEPKDLDDFAQWAQVANYEAMRGMFEAFSLRRPVATGVVQWMLNSAWPDMFWQLYDWYLVPNGAFYATRNSGRPLHVAYDYGTRGVVAVNDTAEPLAGASLRLRTFDLGSRPLRDETRPVALPADSRGQVAVLAAPRGAEIEGGVYFLDLRLVGADGRELASNFYWLPAVPDELDWEKSEWFYTPVRRFADFTALRRMAPARLEVEHRFSGDADGGAVEVTLRNAGEQIAFFVELEVAGAHSGQLAAPILWDDNDVSLLPGETRRLRATFPAHALPEGEEPVLRYRGINLASPAAAAPATERESR